MKRVIILMFVVCILLPLPSCKNNEMKKSEIYFNEINGIISQYDFRTARVTDGEILLFDKDKNIIEEIPFDKYDKMITLIYIRKEENRTFFVTEGSVDDEKGVVFVNPDVNGLLDGIEHIERLGGNSYIYSSY